MKILAIETSCDETALALLEASGDKEKPKFKLRGNVLYSQVEKHKKFGGVYPSLAKREHAENLVPLLEKLLKEAEQNDTNLFFENSDEKNSEQYLIEIKKILEREPNLFEKFLEFVKKVKKPKIDLIAVTSGPGLEPALWVGINFAKALSLFWQIPTIPTNHMEGHIASVLMNSADVEENDKDEIDQIIFPAIALLISGGHTELILVENWGKYKLIGKTNDDAIGEAYDKVARLLNLEYPGGPKISALADIARAEKLQPNTNEPISITLPRPMISSGDFNFSFSGIKTASLYLVQKLKKNQNDVSKKTISEQEVELEEKTKKMVALEFETAVTEVLFKKTIGAIKKHKAETLIIGGGVIANRHIRETFKKLENQTDILNEKIQVLIPEINLTTDNAVMIGIAGYLKSLSKEAQINPEIKADGNLKLSEDKIL